MEEGAHSHTHSAHGTGRRWLDIGLAQAGKELELFARPEAGDDPRWARLRAHMGEIGARVCYCSVFDESHPYRGE
jgi:hypothetical protein